MCVRSKPPRLHTPSTGPLLTHSLSHSPGRPPPTSASLGLHCGTTRSSVSNRSLDSFSVTDFTGNEVCTSIATEPPRSNRVSPETWCLSPAFSTGYQPTTSTTPSSTLHSILAPTLVPVLATRPGPVPSPSNSRAPHTMTTGVLNRPPRFLRLSRPGSIHKFHRKHGVRLGDRAIRSFTGNPVCTESLCAMEPSVPGTRPNRSDSSDSISRDSPETWCLCPRPSCSPPTVEPRADFTGNEVYPRDSTRPACFERYSS